jgi:hypothetical protein
MRAKKSSPRRPKAAVLCQGGLLCTPEAAKAAVLGGIYKIFKGQTVICQGELLCTPEAAEAAFLGQGRLRCTARSWEFWEWLKSRLPRSKTTRRRRLSDGIWWGSRVRCNPSSTPPSPGGGRWQASAGAGGQDINSNNFYLSQLTVRSGDGCRVKSQGQVRPDVATLIRGLCRVESQGQVRPDVATLNFHNTEG